MKGAVKYDRNDFLIKKKDGITHKNKIFKNISPKRPKSFFRAMEKFKLTYS